MYQGAQLFKQFQEGGSCKSGASSNGGGDGFFNRVLRMYEDSQIIKSILHKN